MTKKTHKQSNYRRALISKIHIAKKQLCFDDATYRDVLRLATGGVTSCKDMTITELERALYSMTQKGFVPQKADTDQYGRKPTKASACQPMIDKIGAILADYKLHWNYAHAMAKQMHGKEAVEFCTADELRKLMQALIIHQQRQQRKHTV